MKTPDTTRQRFESFMKRRFPNMPLSYGEEGFYYHDIAQHQWLAWQGALEAASTPPAQEDEPVCQFNSVGDIWHDVDKHQFDYYTLNKFRTRILYTRPDNYGLRKAAEEAMPVLDLLIRKYSLDADDYAVLQNLRAALKTK